MCRNRHSNPYQQQGSMLVISIFIIVVISLLAASLSRILSSTADSVANEVYSAKAYYAADSGMEYGIYKVLDNASFCTDLVIIPLNFLTGEVGLENCSIKLECELIDLPDASKQYYLKSIGTCDGGKIVAQHIVEAEVKL
ncbi:PilX N-terminal domain-containing pilus assembly protein [Moritella dasanensis]|uniref:PilX N-terminal domain-containing pilus assembly protein n=1 Tax=Moritella dasanensis TaxID=428031 RepID=UPI0002E703AF|nr:PilX N-terminal domain-containing pilus assembly protein [Moritella dasanensis]